MNWFRKRGREGSTWAGIAAAIAGLSMVIPGVSDSGGAAVADAVMAGGTTFASTGNWMGALVALLGGLAAVITDKD